MALLPISFGRGILTWDGLSVGNITSFQVEPWQNVFEKKRCVNGRLVPGKVILFESGYQGSFVTDHITAAAINSFCGNHDGSGFVAVGVLEFTGVNPLDGGGANISVKIPNCRISGASIDLITQEWLSIPFRFRSTDTDTGLAEWTV